MSDTTFTISVTTSSAVLFRRLAAACSSDTAPAIAAEEVTEEKPRKTRKPKVEKEPEPAEDEIDEFGLGDDDDAGDESEEESDFEGEEEEEEKPAKKAKAAAIDLDKDIIPAFQKFAAKHSREKAQKILGKYKAKNVRQLPVEKYGEILKLLKA